MSSWSFRCTYCGAQFPPETLVWRCLRCRGVLAVDPPLLLDRGAIEVSTSTLWRYARALPVEPPARTLGEGMTPLVPGQLDGEPVWFKLDFLLPTGSFKDRGASVLVAFLARAGVRRIAVDSSGNAAAALAAYAASHGLEALVFAPADTASEKLLQSRAYGARVELVPGPREVVAATAQAAAQEPGTAYASHNWHPLFAEGTKTWLLEVWEQLGGMWPAACFVPAGGGSLVLGAALAVQGVGTPGPVLVAAQPESCAPLVRAWERQTREVEPVTPGPTLAEGARIGAPPRGVLLLEILRQCGGWPEAVPEPQLVETVRLLWRQGLYVEPTAALGAAAYRLARRRGWVPDGPVVIVLTGSGLKAGTVVRHVIDQV
ncbi:pyridoxal-phosphate dependent enzyme [Thermomicrobium sp. 4228-Ro]|uniref:threonine synthase n=1 Tax=Thermomicrobium sp. 4228-Ro TaxID=2993937 RepID=UPI0022490A76|nr:pyridoxal-phosphate dependent enzyme [Thermomicrobium sp. 4228-Ro]MCX2726567.1 pyridoxal-phosphate dependent enzyme [Thermomicrobium sp. 4228-Ro]